MKLTVKQIRDAYPNPVTSPMLGREKPGRYCVGGALFKSLGVDVDFPDRFPLERALFEANPRLDAANARRFAYMIIDENDAERFGTAWKVLGEALRWKP